MSDQITKIPAWLAAILARAVPSVLLSLGALAAAINQEWFLAFCTGAF